MRRAEGLPGAHALAGTASAPRGQIAPRPRAREAVRDGLSRRWPGMARPSTAELDDGRAIPGCVTSRLGQATARAHRRRGATEGRHARTPRASPSDRWPGHHPACTVNGRTASGPPARHHPCEGWPGFSFRAVAVGVERVWAAGARPHPPRLAVGHRAPPQKERPAVTRRARSARTAARRAPAVRRRCEARTAAGGGPDTRLFAAAVGRLRRVGAAITHDMLR